MVRNRVANFRKNGVSGPVQLATGEYCIVLIAYCVYQLLFYTLLTHNDDVAVHEATLSLKALYFSFHSPILFSIRPGE